MTALETICFSLLLVVLFMSKSALMDDSLRDPDKPCWPKSPGVVECQNNTNSDYEGNELELKRAVNFARQLLTNQSTLPYKERVVEVIDYRQENITEGLTCFLKLRLSESKCDRYNKTCDPVFDPKDWQKGNESRIIAELNSPLTPGKEIEVNGFIPAMSTGFHITLQTTHPKPVEGQLRFRVKFSGGKTFIQLAYFESSWILFSQDHWYLEPRREFQIKIICLLKKFEISIDGTRFKSFSHILPYADTTHLAIIGNVTISRIRGVGNVLPSSSYSPSEEWLDDNIEYEVPSYVPFAAPLARNLAPDRRISITGVVPLYSQGFAITLQNGSEFEPDMAQLRLRVEFFPDGKRENSLWYKEGSWKGKQPEAPAFARGRRFQITITCHDSHFEIKVGNEHFAGYSHQVSYAEATHLSVTGMVNITQVVGVKEIPRVAFLDKPLPGTSYVRLNNVTLVPGRKLRIWTYLSGKTNDFAISLVGGENNMTFPLVLHFLPTPTNPKFQWYTSAKGKEETKEVSLEWLKPGQPLQIEISVFENSHQVTFFGLWSHNFETREPFNSTVWVNFNDLNKGSVIHAVDGTTSTPLPPVASSPPSRICSMTTWHRYFDPDTWLLNDVFCSARNTTLRMPVPTSFDSLPMETSRRLYSKLRYLRRKARGKYRGISLFRSSG